MLQLTAEIGVIAGSDIFKQWVRIYRTHRIRTRSAALFCVTSVNLIMLSAMENTEIT
jgi:hypothetical protein